MLQVLSKTADAVKKCVSASHDSSVPPVAAITPFEWSKSNLEDKKKSLGLSIVKTGATPPVYYVVSAKQPLHKPPGSSPDDIPSIALRANGGWRSSQGKDLPKKEGVAHLSR